MRCAPHGVYRPMMTLVHLQLKPAIRCVDMHPHVLAANSKPVWLAGAQ